MNCREGDTAIIIRSHQAENIGALVKVLCRHIPDAPIGRNYYAFGRVWRNSVDVPLWVVEALGRPLLSAAPNHHLDRVRPWADDALWPIRHPGEDARDEMLRPLPQEITA